MLACCVVVGERSSGDLAGVNHHLFARQEPIQQFPDSQAFDRRARRASGVEGVFLVQIPLQRPVGVVPGTKIVQLAPNLLGPSSRGVGEQREAGVRFDRFVEPPFCVTLGYYDHPLGCECRWPPHMPPVGVVQVSQRVSHAISPSRGGTSTYAAFSVIPRL